MGPTPFYVANSCYRSPRNKLKPVCSRSTKSRKYCQFCISSWRLHRKQLITEANNRRAAKASKERRLLDLEDLENEIDYHTLQLQNECDELENINKLNDAIRAEINKTEEFLNLYNASRG